MKPLILCITGKSGSGKTTLADWLENNLDAPTIQSRTDRKPRFKLERGHTFVSEEEFDSYNIDDMIALTTFGGRRYCCLKEDIKPLNTYVIDEKGILFLKEHHDDIYRIKTLYVHRQERLRRADYVRKQRDKTMFSFTPDDYDYVIDNNFDKRHFFLEGVRVFTHAKKL